MINYIIIELGLILTNNNDYFNKSISSHMTVLYPSTNNKDSKTDIEPSKNE